MQQTNNNKRWQKAAVSYCVLKIILALWAGQTIDELVLENRGTSYRAGNWMCVGTTGILRFHKKGLLIPFVLQYQTNYPCN